MKQTIQTAYLPPTDGSPLPQIAAWTSSGIRRCYPYTDHDDERGICAHTFAAKSLAKELDWKGRFVIGALDDTGAVVFVLDDGDADGFTL